MPIYFDVLPDNIRFTKKAKLLLGWQKKTLFTLSIQRKKLSYEAISFGPDKEKIY